MSIIFKGNIDQFPTLPATCFECNYGKALPEKLPPTKQFL